MQTEVSTTRREVVQMQTPVESEANRTQKMLQKSERSGEIWGEAAGGVMGEERRTL